MRCSSCDKPKANLYPRKSSLMRGSALYLCQECIDRKLEPRWIIILVGRRDGVDSVREYIQKGRYCGKKILAEELLV